jgi:hypothetical protein
MFCFRVVELTNQVLAANPFELFWVNQDIAGESAAGELATARAVAVLENVFGAVKLVADRLAQAATPRGFAHSFDLPVI